MEMKKRDLGEKKSEFCVNRYMCLSGNFSSSFFKHRTFQKDLDAYSNTLLDLIDSSAKVIDENVHFPTRHFLRQQAECHARQLELYLFQLDACNALRQEEWKDANLKTLAFDLRQSCLSLVGTEYWKKCESREYRIAIARLLFPAKYKHLPENFADLSIERKITAMDVWHSLCGLGTDVCISEGIDPLLATPIQTE